jgi:hypothetical protein
MGLASAQRGDLERGIAGVGPAVGVAEPVTRPALHLERQAVQEVESLPGRGLADGAVVRDRPLRRPAVGDREPGPPRPVGRVPGVALAQQEGELGEPVVEEARRPALVVEHDPARPERHGGHEAPQRAAAGQSRRSRLATARRVPVAAPKVRWPTRPRRWLSRG